MYENYEGDLIFKIMSEHLSQEGNLNHSEIKAKVLEDRITISSTSLQTRIDEFKRSQAYKDLTENDSDS
jgi:uncharacterized protein YjaG (DUF416 family)